MPTSVSEITMLTIIVSTLLLLLFGSVVMYYIFLYQKRRYRHQQEVVELREAFSQTLLQSKLEIQEQTLDHIAKELHANFSQLVSLININLSEILPQSSEQVKESVVETKSLAKQLLSELKALSASLNTDHIMHIGFASALNNELNRLSKAKKYQISITKTGDEYRLLPEHEIILFRLCQEILNNVLKYANATTLAAALHYTPEQLTVEIADNGVGFDMVSVERERAARESTGLLNIQKRARLINAGVTVKSALGEGTTAVITIPRTT